MPSPIARQRSPHNSLSRASATGSALRRGDLKISDPIPVSGQLTVSGQPLDDSGTPTRVLDGTWPRKSTPPAGRVRSGSSGYREPAEAQPTSYNEATRMSMGPSIVQSSMSTLPSKTSLNQKSPRGFKAAIRRLFGGKRRTSSFSEARKAYHRSDPSNLTSIVEKQPIDRPVARTPSHPVGNITRSSALGSHSPFAVFEDRRDSRWRPPDDWRSIGSRHKRRNTLPSVVLSQQEAQMIADALRPNNTRPYTDLDISDPTPASTSTALKRRSRSADALGELAESYQVSQTDPRRRSDEIAYWRTSAIDNPAPFYTGPPPESQKNQYNLPASHTAPTHRANPSQATMSPMQTFDFGLPDGTNENASLEQRVGTLEIKVVDFEYAIAKLQGHDLPRPAAPAKTPKRRSIHELFPLASSQATTSSNRSRQAIPTTESIMTPVSVADLTFLSSSSSTKSPNVGYVTDGDSGQANRSSGSATIRVSNLRNRSSRRSNDPSPSSTREDDRFETIMALLKEEQKARRRLEARLRQLQKEIDELRAPVYAYIRPMEIPTPSPDSSHHTPMQPKVRPLHRTPAFPDTQRANVHETSRFSMTDSMTEPEDEDEEEKEDESDTDDGFSDVYETPQESKFGFSPDHARNTSGSPLVTMI